MSGYRASGPVRARFPHGSRVRGPDARTLGASARRTAVVVNTVAIVAAALVDADAVLDAAIANDIAVVPRTGARKPDWRLPVCSTASSATVTTRTPR
jgi:hypothetical protein